MGTNKVVSVVLLDVNNSMANQSDNGETFFERSKNCLKKMIMRKMFSQDNDEMSIILFGSDNTDNQLARGSTYQNISVFSRINLPSWELYKKVENLDINKQSRSDWIEAVIVAIDFIKTETMGRKFKDKQIVVFSNCAGDTFANEDSVKPVLNVMEGENIQFIVVGNDVEEELSQNVDVPNSMVLMLNTITKLESGIHLSFSDIEKDIEYFSKKRKMCRLNKVNLTIGSNIHLPVRCMKVTNEETRWRWDFPPSQQIRQAFASSLVPPQASSLVPPQADVDQSVTVEYVTDMVKKTNFGGSLVDLGYADLEAMKRQTGPASLIYIGCIKNKKITPSMFVGKDVYVVVPDKDARSVSMFSALVNALIKAEKYGIARRIPMKNGKVSVGVLLPVNDELGTALYFLKLPYKEWVRKVPEKHLPEATNKDGLQAMSDLIDSATLPDDLLEEGKGLLVKCPTFQSRCHALGLRALGLLPELSVPDHPEFVLRILRPIEMNEEAKDALSRLAEIFPYTPSEDSSSPKKKANPLPKPQPTPNVTPLKKEDESIKIEEILNKFHGELDNAGSQELF